MPRLPGVAVTVSDAGDTEVTLALVPETLSQLPPVVVDALALNWIDPEPRFEMVNCCEAGLAPCGKEKARLAALVARLPGMAGFTTTETAMVCVCGVAARARMVMVVE